jgi:hypothetical protein
VIKTLRAVLELSAELCRDAGSMADAQALEEKLAALSRMDESPSNT